MPNPPFPQIGPRPRRRGTLAAAAFCLLLHAAAAARGEEPGGNPNGGPDGGENDPPPGHSHVGEAFNTGPRQSATAIPGCGDAHLPITTSWAGGQAFFDQGLAQLHGFWYYEAERSFREIAAHDPGCAMAYWGMAMANFENERRARWFSSEAAKRSGDATPYERMWIEAQEALVSDPDKDAKDRRRDQIKRFEAIIHEFPDDIEARAFLACRLWQFSRQGLPISSHQAVDALLDQVFAASPLHPSHHYRIHLWDREKPERALGSSAVLHSSAPAIAHMWHMPGHIYDRLHRYPESAWHQEASARVDHTRMREQRVMPDEIFNYAHNSEWLVRNWGHVGRARAAIDLAKGMLDNPRHPDLNTYAKSGRSAALGRERLFDTLERFELWHELLQLADGPYLPPTDREPDQVERLRMTGIAHFELGSAGGLARAADALRATVGQLGTEKAEAEAEAREDAEADGEAPEKTDEIATAAGKPLQRRIDTAQRALDELELYARLLDGGDGTSLTDESLDKIKRSKHAKAQIALRYGDAAEAEELARAAVEGADNSTVPLAILTHVLQERGDLDAAAETFERLRSISAHVDLASPPFARLAWLAGRLGHGRDWRSQTPFGDDFGDKPQDIAHLGPMNYVPPAAPGFSLPDENGRVVELADYRGRAVVVLFYIGHSCSHCVEQLNAFAVRAEDYRSAGIELVAVSCDSESELAGAHALCEGGLDRFPFPLLADPDLTAFKAFRAYDDFEQLTLHGTFLVGPDGDLRWQDVDANPFDDAGFLLEEAKRLLALRSS